MQLFLPTHCRTLFQFSPPFLVAWMWLYKPLCRLVGPWVCRSLIARSTQLMAIGLVQKWCKNYLTDWRNRLVLFVSLADCQMFPVFVFFKSRQPSKYSAFQTPFTHPLSFHIHGPLSFLKNQIILFDLIFKIHLDENDLMKEKTGMKCLVPGAPYMM